MFDPSLLLTAIQEDLVAAGLVRKPTTSSPLTPCYVEPSSPPAPGDRAETQGSSIVLTVRIGGEVSGGPEDAAFRSLSVDFILRSQSVNALTAARILWSEIRARYLVPAQFGPGLTISEGGPSATNVLTVAQTGGLGPVGTTRDVRTERAALTFTVLA